jgi:trk system potassium uptake protein TrkA
LPRFGHFSTAFLIEFGGQPTVRRQAANGAETMHIIIVGAGRVGWKLAKMLAEEQQDVYVIERDEKLARELEDQLDVQVIHGSGFSQAILYRAGINKADLLLAVTHSDETNLITTITAERIAPKCKTVCRVRDPRFIRGTDALDAKKYGVDYLISPEEAVAKQIVSVLQYDGPGQVSSLADGNLVLMEFPVQPHSVFGLATLAEIRAGLPSHTSIIAVLSGESLRITNDDDRFKVGDRIIVLCVPGEINDVLILGGSDPVHVNRILLIGGGDTGEHVAKELARLKFDVTIIEQDLERAEAIAAKLDKCTVIHGNGMLPAEMDEHIRDGHQAVAVLVDDDSKSLLGAITAKHYGAAKVIARVANQDYGAIARKAGIDALISPPRAMANSILHFARKHRSVSTTLLGNHLGELLDFELDQKPPRKLLDTPIGKLKMPEGSRIGAIIRNNEMIVPDPEATQLEPGDHVFIVAMRAAISKVGELFG